MSLLSVAQKYVGLQEMPGTGNNTTILQWAKTLGINYTADSIAWCALFMSWVVYEAGLDGLRTLRAQEWLKAGTPITDPEIGAIAILWRDSPSSGLGHVGIITDSTADTITLLGGNQDNAVGYGIYPKSRVLGYRRLEGTIRKSKKTKIVVVCGIILLIGISFYLWRRHRKEKIRIANKSYYFSQRA